MNQYIIKTFALVTIFFTLNSCAQNIKKLDTMNTEYITKVKEIYKNIKSYDYNPTYQIRFDKFNCPIEFYINDILVIYLSDSGKAAGEQNIDIPQYILKSGAQTIRIKIYPLLDKNKNFEKFVSKDVKLKLRVVYGDYRRELQNWANFKEVFEVELPKIDHNVPFIEFSKEFNAIVPYELEGWSNGVDLSQEDPKKLEEEVLGRMKEIAELYRNKNIEGLAKEQYNRSKEVEQCFYMNKKEKSEQLISELQEGLNESIKTEVLEGKMKLMANGKLVTILIDKGAFFNKSIIRDEKKDTYVVYPQYFYRPAPGAKLEIIR